MTETSVRLECISSVHQSENCSQEKLPGLLVKFSLSASSIRRNKLNINDILAAKTVRAAWVKNDRVDSSQIESIIRDIFVSSFLT